MDDEEGKGFDSVGVDCSSVFVLLFTKSISHLKSNGDIYTVWWFD